MLPARPKHRISRSTYIRTRLVIHAAFRADQMLRSQWFWVVMKAIAVVSVPAMSGLVNGVSAVRFRGAEIVMRTKHHEAARWRARKRRLREAK